MDLTSVQRRTRAHGGGDARDSVRAVDGRMGTRTARLAGRAVGRGV